MSSVQINFAVSTQEGRFKAVNGSRLVNLYPEIKAEGSKTRVILCGTPGQSLFCALPTGPIQGAHVMDGELYVVTSTKFYHVKWNGEYEELGDVVCNGRVSMATNGIHLVWVNGIRGYAYSIVDGVYELQGEGWYPANTVTHQDGYFIFNRQSTGQFFLSNLLSTEFDALDYATAESSPDDTMAIISDQRALWLFGTNSTEIWYNAGGDFPFQRMQGAYIEKGIASPYSAAKLDNGIFFLGADGIAYRTNGYTLQRISTHDIEYDYLSGSISDAYAYAYSEHGHSFYVLTIPAKQATIVYDVASGLWHNRSHSVHGRHNAQGYAYCYGKHIIGDYQSGNIFALDDKAYTDNGDMIVREAVAPVMHNNNNPVSMYGFELQIENPGVTERSDYRSPGLLFEDDSGVLLLEDGSYFRLEGPEPELDEMFNVPKVTLRFSDDGQKTWSSPWERKFGRDGAGLVRVKWGPMGQFVERHIKITITDPVPVSIAGAYTEVV